MLKVTQNPAVISFGGGLPAAELFPVEDVSAAQDRVMRTRGATALQYSVTDGIRSCANGSLRACERSRGWTSMPTTWSSPAARNRGSISTRASFLDPGDVVALENPSYLGAIQASTPSSPVISPSIAMRAA